MSKVLIIGSSYSIKDTFSKKFNLESITFLNFREAWLMKEISYYDIIVISGFHHDKIKVLFPEFKKYIIEYFNFILLLESKCNELLLITTFIPSKISFSRVVFLYKSLLNLVDNKSKIKPISFRKIIHENNKNSLALKLLEYFGLKFTQQNDIIKNTEKYILKNIPNPYFVNLKIRRNMSLERFLRLLDYG